MNRAIVNYVAVWGASAAIAIALGMVAPPCLQPSACAAEWSDQDPMSDTNSTDTAKPESTMHESMESTPMESSTMTAMPMDVVRTSKLLDMKVQGTQNEELGKVHDIVLTPDLTSLSYVALARGGVAGVGEKLYAIPWSAVSVSADGKSLMVHIDKKDLENSPGFNSKSWPDRGEARWSKTTGQPESTMTMSADSETFRMRRVSEVSKIEVKNREDKTLGKLDDLAVDKTPGRVVYGIVSWGNIGKKESYAAVPWDMFILQPKPRIAMLHTDKSTLETLAFEKSNWPNLSDRSYAESVYQRFGEEPYWQVYGHPTVEPRLVMTDSWLPGSEYNQMFSASSVTTIKGKVDSTGSFRPASHAASGLRLKVTTSDGKALTVHCGPREYISQQGFTFKKGEEVTVTGSEVQMGKRTVLMATEIDAGGKMLKLRDSQGNPTWTKDDLQKELMMKGEKKTEKEMPGSSGSRGY